MKKLSSYQKLKARIKELETYNPKSYKISIGDYLVKHYCEQEQAKLR
jgi:hypothetical protein